MKKGYVGEGIVERVEFPAKGIVKSGDEYVTVKNCLPGQKISFMVNKVRHHKAEARLLEVLEKSPLETGDICPHFGFCGGCTYLSLNYEEQCKLKESQVKSILKDVLERQSSPYIFESIKGSPDIYEYRNKMEFSFGDEYKDGPLALGLHKRASTYDVVQVSGCKIIDGDYRLILDTTLQFCREHELSYFHKMRHEGYCRHLLVRKAKATGEILVALVTTSQYGDDTQLMEAFKERMLQLEKEQKLQGKIAGVLHILNDGQADVVKSDRTDILYGQDFFYEKLLGLTFKVSTFSFFQTNSRGAEVLYNTAREYIGKMAEDCKVIYDLYSGTGTIAQLMAPVCEKVIGVEIVEEAVEAAKENAKQNGLHNVEFIAGDVLKVLDDIETKPDLIILDPPRDGIHPKALPKIVSYGVPRMLYISCKPTSLARDLDLMREAGYEVEKCVAVDQFPWTANVETIALLKKVR